MASKKNFGTFVDRTQHGKYRGWVCLFDAATDLTTDNFHQTPFERDTLMEAQRDADTLARELTGQEQGKDAA